MQLYKNSSFQKKTFAAKKDEDKGIKGIKVIKIIKIMKVMKVTKVIKVSSATYISDIKNAYLFWDIFPKKCLGIFL